ncbi:hypothetical protein PoB_003824400 [Plakobranchus ocellatus]|uniref:Uncharacterized protein n=1 Tax=Plakobranchus ocellatus TaxID=259542 RepID=A0AAV4AZC7_9GAST|nr:hypothetical protein PoB_003824400 [Plakobranchus ocellatus]
MNQQTLVCLSCGFRDEVLLFRYRIDVDVVLPAQNTSIELEWMQSIMWAVTISGSVGGTVDSESALRSAGILLFAGSSPATSSLA